MATKGPDAPACQSNCRYAAISFTGIRVGPNHQIGVDVPALQIIVQFPCNRLRDSRNQQTAIPVLGRLNMLLNQLPDNSCYCVFICIGCCHVFNMGS